MSLDRPVMPPAGSLRRNMKRPEQEPKGKKKKTHPNKKIGFSLSSHLLRSLVRGRSEQAFIKFSLYFRDRLRPFTNSTPQPPTRCVRTTPLAPFQRR